MSWFRSGISFLIIFQLIVQTGAPTIRSNIALAAPNSGLIPTHEHDGPPTLALLVDQERIQWKKGRVVKKFSLNDPDIRIPRVRIVDFESQIEIEPKPGDQSVHFHRIGRGKKILDTHTISGLEVTGPIITEPRMILIPTVQGIRVILIEHFNQLAFNQPIPVLTIPRALLGSLREKIVEINVIRTQIENETENPVYVGDFRITLEGISGNHRTKTISRNQMIDHVLKELLVTLLSLHVADPELDQLNELAEFFSAYSNELQEQRHEIEKALSGKQAGIYERVLRALGTHHRSGLLKESFEHLQSEKTAQRDLAPEPSTSEQAEPKTRKERVQAFLEDHQQKHALQLASERTLRGRLWTRTMGLFRQVTRPRSWLTLAALLSAGTYLAGETPSEIAQSFRIQVVRTISSTWDQATQLPLMHLLASDEEYAETKDILSHAENWLPLGVGILSMSVLFLIAPLAIWSTRILRKNQKRSAGIAKETLEKFLSLYLWGNRVRELFAKVLRQKNLYRALDAEVSYRNPLVWNSPFARSSQIDERASTLNDEIRNLSQKNSETYRILALLRTSQKTGIDPATLLQTDRTGVRAVVSSLLDPSTRTEMDWARGAHHVRQVIDEVLHKEGCGNSELEEDWDLETLVRHEDRWDRLAQSLTTSLRDELPKESDSARSSARAFLQKKAEAARIFFHNSFVPDHLLGRRGRQLNQEIGEVDLDPATVETSTVMIASDYPLGSFAWGITTPNAFMWPDIHSRIVTTRLEDVVNSWGQTPADVAATHLMAKGSFSNNQSDYPSVGGEVFREQRRQQSFWEAGSIFIRSSLDSELDEGARFSEVMRQWIQNLVDGFPIRFILNTLSFAGLFLARDVHASEIPWASVTASLNIIMSEVSFFYFAGTLTLGWVLPYALANYGANLLEDHAEENLSRLEKVGTTLFQAIQSGDGQTRATAIRELKSCYHEGHQELPEVYNVDSEVFTDDLSLSFLAYAAKNPPFATKRSLSMLVFMNLFFASIPGVMLYNQIQIPIMEKQGASIAEVGLAAALMAGTYVGWGLASKWVFQPVVGALDRKMIRPTLDRVRKWKWTCQEILGGRARVNPH